MTLEEMLGTLVADHKQQIVERAIEKLSARLAKTCLPDAETAYRDQVRNAIADLVSKQMDKVAATPIVETNGYGEPVRGGKTMTLIELVVKQTESHLNEMVDKEGHGSRSGYGGTRDRTRAQFLGQKAAEELCKKQLEPAIEEAKKAFRDSIGNKLSSVFKETLDKALKS
jgi:6-phosphofructokinase